jgi:hypothetical protein
MEIYLQYRVSMTHEILTQRVDTVIDVIETLLFVLCHHFWVAINVLAQIPDTVKIVKDVQSGEISAFAVAERDRGAIRFDQVFLRDAEVEVYARSSITPS